jgi:hypothetical protein
LGGNNLIIPAQGEFGKRHPVLGTGMSLAFFTVKMPNKVAIYTLHDISSLFKVAL